MTEDPNIDQQPTGMMQDNILSTKVSPEVYAQFKSICNKYGFSIFVALRMLAETLVRFGDDKHNLSESLIRAIRMFENIPGWSKSICLADDGQEFGIVEAIYILRAPGKDGYRICWVERPMLDGDAYGWNGTYNVQFIFERFIEVMNPSLYKHLRLLAVELGTESMLDTVHRIADEFMENPDEIELRLQFEGNDWHNGAQMHEDKAYKRPYTHGMDYIEKQQTLFNDEEDAI